MSYDHSRVQKKTVSLCMARNQPMRACQNSASEKPQLFKNLNFSSGLLVYDSSFNFLFSLYFLIKKIIACIDSFFKIITKFWLHSLCCILEPILHLIDCISHFHFPLSPFKRVLLSLLCRELACGLTWLQTPNCNFFLIYFNWRLITLQHCSGFWPYIDMNPPWVYMCSPSWTPLPPPSPSHPSGSSQCTSPECPVSCIEPGLAICFTYDNIHVSMLFSPTLAISHRVQKSVLYTCVFCCPTCRVIITIFLNSIYIH